MSTLLDLIQTKVNYVVQEAIVVIKDIFRKYPNKYVPVPPGEAAAALWEGKARRGLSPPPFFWATNHILKGNPPLVFSYFSFAVPSPLPGPK